MIEREIQREGKPQAQTTPRKCYMLSNLQTLLAKKAPVGENLIGLVFQSLPLSVSL
jgi:hypothetical protein